MGFIAKVMTAFSWLIAAVVITQVNQLSNQQALLMTGIGLLVIVFWSGIKKLVSDRYEDGRSHRNRRRQLELELQAMERRITLAMLEQRAGHDRSMELMQFRQQLLAMEAAENEAMVRAMIATLDSVK